MAAASEVHRSSCVDASVVKYVQRQMEMLVNEEKKPPFGDLEVTFVVGGDTSRRR